MKNNYNFGLRQTSIDNRKAQNTAEIESVPVENTNSNSQTTGTRNQAVREEKITFKN